jgi:uracil-DNA glycosylase
LNPKAFVTLLSEVRLPAVFNPYVDTCKAHDRADAPARRKQNLQLFLEAALDKKIETIWIARDLGYRGGRRTGVALTDDVHLERASRWLDGASFRRATRGPAVAERTAAVVWKVLSEIDEPVFLWNVFPFHPHEPSDPFSNRCHTREERLIALPLLETLIDMIRPRQLVAIGRDAQLALADIETPVATVRHPSYGGQTEFMSGLYSLYGVKPTGRSKGEAVLL